MRRPELKLRAHPEVRVLADRASGRVRAALKDFTDCVVLALGAVFVLYGSDMLALMGTETAPHLPISMVYPYLSIPVCGALLVFHSAVRIAVSHLAPRRADRGRLCCRASPNISEVNQSCGHSL